VSVPRRILTNKNRKVSSNKLAMYVQGELNVTVLEEKGQGHETLSVT
jgi:hypothetical protein